MVVQLDMCYCQCIWGHLIEFANALFLFDHVLSQYALFLFYHVISRWCIIKPFADKCSMDLTHVVHCFFHCAKLFLYTCFTRLLCILIWIDCAWTFISESAQSRHCLALSFYQQWLVRCCTCSTVAKVAPWKQILIWVSAVVAANARLRKSYGGLEVGCAGRRISTAIDVSENPTGMNDQLTRLKKSTVLWKTIAMTL